LVGCSRGRERAASHAPPSNTSQHSVCTFFKFQPAAQKSHILQSVFNIERTREDSTASTIRSTAFRGQHSRLEALPAELQAAILRCLPDIPTLHALIRASPLYHQSYVVQRPSILLTVLSNDMTPGVLDEARFVFEAAKIRRGDSDDAWISDVESFLKGYRQHREGKVDQQPNLKPLDLEATISLVQLHCSIMGIADDFHYSALSKHPISGQNLKYQELSSSERRRIYRACYRIEIFTYLFANFIWHDPPATMFGSLAGALFFPEFNYWEIEEIFCIRDYIFRVYDKMFWDCEEELFKFFFREEESDGFPTQTEEDVLARMREKSKSFTRV
jgi:hypothetical protein